MDLLISVILMAAMVVASLAALYVYHREYQLDEQRAQSRYDPAVEYPYPTPERQRDHERILFFFIVIALLIGILFVASYLWGVTL